MPRIIQREAKIPGWSIETGGYGVDPVGTRLEVGGIVKRWRPKLEDNVESYVGLGGSPHVKSFFRKGREVEWEMAWLMKREQVTSSLLAMTLGDAPSGGTGVITLRGNSTNNNLRSMTLEDGWDSQSNDRFYQIKGAMVREARLTLKDHLVDVLMSGPAQDRTKSSAATGTLPTSQPSPRPFDPDADATWAFTGPAGAITGVEVAEATFDIMNELKVKSTQMGAASRNIGEPQWVGRKVTLKLSLWRTLNTFDDLYADNDPSGSAAELDVDLTLSKNAGAEFLKVNLTDCRIVEAYTVELKDEDDLVYEELTLEPESHAWDVLTP